RAEDGDDEQAGAAADQDRQALLLDRALTVVARQEVDSTHLVLDPQADSDGQGADLLRLADLLRDLHATKWIADAHAHADQALELAREAGEMRGAAREHDLADAERARLVLVVLERGDELAGERLDRPAHCVPCLF